MALTYKVLGQSNPSSNTNTDLYTVPSATSTVCSTLVICNQAASAATFRIAVRPAGATLAAEHYIAYDSSINANDTVTLTIGQQTILQNSWTSVALSGGAGGSGTVTLDLYNGETDNGNGTYTYDWYIFGSPGSYSWNSATITV